MSDVTKARQRCGCICGRIYMCLLLCSIAWQPCSLPQVIALFQAVGTTPVKLLGPLLCWLVAHLTARLPLCMQAQPLPSARASKAEASSAAVLVGAPRRAPSQPLPQAPHWVAVHRQAPLLALPAPLLLPPRSPLHPQGAAAALHSLALLWAPAAVRPVLLSLGRVGLARRPWVGASWIPLRSTAESRAHEIPVVTVQCKPVAACSTLGVKPFAFEQMDFSATEQRRLGSTWEGHGPNGPILR